MSLNTTKGQQPVPMQQKVLKFALLMLCTQMATSLKLTQVPYLAKTLDLDQETRWITTAFNDAKATMMSDDGGSTELDASTLLHNRAIKRLHSSIERWSLVEDRLQNGILNSDQNQVRVFDEALSVIAAGRVLLGHLFWRSKGDDMALKELEPSCPILWEYDVARTSLDNDGWLDCFSTLGDIYVRRSRLEHAVELEKELISRMPWLALTFSGKPTNFKLRTLATISHLTRVTREERRMISVYIKNAWNTAESLRAQLNELVSEFVLSDTDKRRKKIYLRTQHAVEEALQRFVLESNVSILQHSRILKLRSSDTNSAHLADDLVTESEASIRKRECTLLNSALRVELHREASFYLSTMDGIIEGGKHYLPAIRIRELEKAHQKLSSKNPPALDRDGVSNVSDSPSLSSITAAPMGFQSKDQVMQVFEYLLAHQTEEQDQTEIVDIAAVSAKATRKTVSSNSPNKSGSGTRRAHKSANSNKQEKKSSEKDGGDETNSSPTRGYMGLIMALCLGSGLALGRRNKEQAGKSSNGNNTSNIAKNRGEKSTAHCNRISKEAIYPIKNEETKDNHGNFLLAFFLILTGRTTTSKVSRHGGTISAVVFHWLRIMYSNASSNIEHLLLSATSLFTWIQAQATRSLHKMYSQIKERTVSKCIKPDILTSWTTASLANTHKKKSRIEVAFIPAVLKTQLAKPLKSDVTKISLSPDIAKSTKKKSKAASKVIKDIVQPPATVTTLSKQVESLSSEIMPLQLTILEYQSDESFLDCVLDTSSQPRDDCNPVIAPQTSNTISPTLSPMKLVSIPSSPSSVTALCDNQSNFLSDAQVFDDSYWTSIDNEAEGEGAWIDTSTTPIRGKLKRAQNEERISRTTKLPSKQKQELFKQQLARKSVEAAFSSISMTGRDRLPNLALHQARRGTATSQKRTTIGSSSTPSSSTSIAPVTATVPRVAMNSPVHPKDISATATAALKIMLAKNCFSQSQLSPTHHHTTITSNFPPLPTDGSHSSTSSGAENSTDAEDHSSVSGDSHLSSPRSRSLSYCHDTSVTPDEQTAERTINQPIQQGQVGHLMQIPYYPLGYMPMPMSLQQTIYDPSMNVSYTPPSGVLSPEQQQGLMQHQRAMIMMPFPPLYMIPHPLFDPMQLQHQHQHQHQHISVVQGNHVMNITDEQIKYNNNLTQTYFENQILSNNMNISAPIPITAESVTAGNDIVNTVRQQIAYYFSSDNLCHDIYLRSKMDSDGFVRLSEISKWNRIRRIGASPYTILEAVQSCNTLETRVLWDVESARGNEEETAALSSISILATLIRCVDNPLAWVLQHPINNSSASNDTDTGSTFSTF